MSEMITLKQFWNSKEKLAIHCDTEVKSKKLLFAFDKMGKRWSTGTRYTAITFWEAERENTCYNNKGTYDEISCCNCKGIKIYEFEEVDLQEKSTTTMTRGELLADKELVENYCDIVSGCDVCALNVKKIGSGAYCVKRLENIFSDEFLSEKVEVPSYLIKPKEILTEKEKKYLWGVIKPFAKMVKYIAKRPSVFSEGYEYIKIGFDGNFSCIFFPRFEAKAMYRGMEADIAYTLEELGLTKEKME